MSRTATIVATLTTPPEPALLEALGRVADVLEVRADLIGDLDVAYLRDHFPGELLYTLRSSGEGGAWRGSDAERSGRLSRAAAGYDLVDVEATRDAVHSTVVDSGRRLVSWHGPAQTVGELSARLASMRETPARLYKLIPAADGPAEAGRPLEMLLARDGAPVVAFASGEAGAWTRLLAPRLGEPWVYGAVGELPGAPGQIPLDRLLEDYGLPRLAPVRRLFGLAGAPVGASLSPRLHNGLYRTAGLEALYVAFHVESFGAFWIDCVETGLFERLGVPLCGLSVTSPHKEIAQAVAGASSPIASRIGAANTLVPRRGVWEAEATDPDGVVVPLERRSVGLPGCSAAIVGVGGAGRAAAVGLERAGARVTLVNRGRGRGERASRRLRMPFCALADFAPDAFDIVVNATPVGGGPAEPLPFDPADMRTTAVLVDMVYRRTTPSDLVLAAREAGLEAVDGREVLLCQAGPQFHMMTGLDLPLGPGRRLLGLE